MSKALFAQTYKTASGEQLQRYLRFLQSDAGRQFTLDGGEALNDALSKAADALGLGLPGTRDDANT